MAYIQLVYGFFLENLWIVQVVTIALLTFIFQWVVRRLLNRVQRHLSKTAPDHFKQHCLSALKGPFSVLIWLVGLTLMLEFMAQTFGDNRTVWIIDRSWDVALILLVIWVLLNVLKRTESQLAYLPAPQRKIDKTTLRAMGQIGRGLVIGGGILAILPVLGVPISGVVAFGGFGGIAVTFAAKDLLSNYLGSMMVFFDRPFEVGDWIRVPQHGIEGTVETIAWRLTRVRTFDKRPLYVPNGVFSTSVLENPSRMSHRRINTQVGVHYEDAQRLAPILAAVKMMVKQDPGVDDGQTLLVNFVEFGHSSLNFIIYAFTHTTDWAEFFDIRERIYLKTIDIIHSHGAQCALPEQRLHFSEPLKVQSLTQET